MELLRAIACGPNSLFTGAHPAIHGYAPRGSYLDPGRAREVRVGFDPETEGHDIGREPPLGGDHCRDPALRAFESLNRFLRVDGDIHLPHGVGHQGRHVRIEGRHRFWRQFDDRDFQSG
jgi:hypothetical protein